MKGSLTRSPARAGAIRRAFMDHLAGLPPGDIGGTVAPHLRALAGVPCLVVLLASCGGGHAGPTAPAAQAEIAGTWDVTWAPQGSPFAFAGLGLMSQSGATASGTLSLAAFPFSITGPVTGSSYQWQAPDGGCGSFKGSVTFSGLAPTQMSGTATLDTTACSSGQEILTGAITWIKASNTSESRPLGRHRPLAGLIAALKAAAGRQ
jgi:hypothetical protein